MTRPSPINHDQRHADPPTPWNLGDIHTFRLPKAHGNSWQRCLDPILREDKLKCQAWNDEVQTLLIFAGLFSAVVTAFVIQSYQDIQQISTNQAVALILINHAANNNTSSSSILSNAASTLAAKGSYSSSERVNIVWFLSLILSLTTVLVGIIAMQWIREYQHYSDSSSAKRKIAIRNMRTDGLEKWKVPQIIAGLPLILQTAVILFFIGLIDFLLNISIVIAVPAIVVITVALLFIFMTIALPAYQCFWIVNSHIPEDQISQCPYKSPQAWTFLQTLSQPLLRWHLLPFVLFPLAMIIAALLPFGFLISKVARIQTPSFSTLSYFMHKFIKNLGKKNLSSWDSFDGLFLKRRNQIISNAGSAKTKTNIHTASTGPLFEYDAAMGIASFLNEHVYEKSLARAAYDCFRELPSAIITDDFLVPKDVSRVWTTHGHERSLRISDILPPMLCHTKMALQQHENEILFLEHLFHPLETDSLPILRDRQLELFVRMLGHIFTDNKYSQHTVGGFNSVAVEMLAHSLRRNHLRGLLVPSILTNSEAIHTIPEDTIRGITLQIMTIFRAFITQAIKSEGRNVSVFCQREDLLCDLVLLVHTVTVAASFRYPSSQPPHIGADPLSEQLKSVVCMLSSNIHSSMSGPPLDALCYTGVLFVCHFRANELDLWQKRFPEVVPHLTNLIYSLRAHEKSRDTLTNFFLRHNKYIAQWELLVSSVITKPLQHELDTNIAGPALINASRPRGEANEDHLTVSSYTVCGSIEK